MGFTKVSQKAIADAIQLHGGNVAAAARALGVTRRNVWMRIAKSPELRAVLDDERDSLVDEAESVLRQEIHAHNITAVIWALKASPAAKARGWGERSEVTGANGGPVQTEEVGLSDADRASRIAALFDRARARAAGQAADGDSGLLAGGEGESEAA